MKKGFTLIELLAVIVILAIIALIATPIVLSIINDTKESALVRSGGFYVDAVQNKIMQENMKLGGTLNPKECIIDSDGNVTCDGTFLEIEVDGQKPTGGKIIFDKGKVTDVNLIIGDKSVILDTNGELILGEISYVPTAAECFETEELEDGTLMIKDYICPDITDVVIPDEIGGKKVTKIYSWYEIVYCEDEGCNGDTYYYYGPFQNKNLTSIILSNNITTIENGAFFENKLTSITIPNSVTTIGESAFKNNRLTSVAIPSSVTTIGWYAFANNQLTSVAIPNGVEKIYGYAFANNQLTSATLPNSVIYIGESAFKNNQLTRVAIPNSVTNIGNSAFSNNQLSGVTIPNSVASIGSSAFNNNKLPDSQAFIYARNSDGTVNNAVIVSYGGAKRDNVVIPNGVTTIGSYAFANNQLTSVTIPSSVMKMFLSFVGNELTNVIIEGKSSPSDFSDYGDWNGQEPFDWATGYSDSNITWQP